MEIKMGREEREIQADNTEERTETDPGNKEEGKKLTQIGKGQMAASKNEKTFLFILPIGSAKPVCLVCSETVGNIKSGNVKHHMRHKILKKHSH